MCVIKKIEITNLFGEKNIAWELHRDVNILGGDNGSGKTTILRSCYELIQNGNLPAPLAQLVGSVTIHFTNGWRLELEKIENANTVNLPHVGGNAFVTLGPKGNVTMTQVPHLFDDHNKPVNFASLKDFCHVYFVSSFERTLSEAIQLGKITPAEDAASTYLDALIKQQLDLRNEKFAGAMEQLMEQFSASFGKPLQIKATPEIKNYLDFYQSLGKFLTGYKIGIDNRINVIKKGKTDVPIPYTRLSSGEKQLLYILLVAVNTQHENSVLFMDEPDLSLHVDWKKILIREIMNINPNLQLIVATHAPSMITGWFEHVKEVSNIQNA